MFDNLFGRKQDPFIVVDPTLLSTEGLKLEAYLLAKVIGQESAIKQLVNFYQIYISGLHKRDRPITNLLFLGPTGSGKTRLVECLAEFLIGTSKGMIKIDCSEFQHGHEISKLISSPPGYLGHSSTPARITQEKLDQFGKDKPSIVLFDEIEKAAEEFHQLLLGVLDKGILTLGNNAIVDFSNTIVIMTSNLGSGEVQRVVSNAQVGFSPPIIESKDVDNRIKKISNLALEKKFSSEFINRIDKTIVFKSLTSDSIGKIIDIELAKLEDRIIASGNLIILKITNNIKEYIRVEGTSSTYGARELVRVIEQRLVFPIANLIATHQVQTGDILNIDCIDSKVVFTVLQNALPPADASDEHLE